MNDNWLMKRTDTYREYSNKLLLRSGNDENDTSPTYQDLIPDNDDKIYDIDGPAIVFVPNHTMETYNNFTEWVTWKELRCSDNAYWHYQARVNDDLDAENKPYNHDTDLNDVGVGHKTIPQVSQYP